MASSTGDEIITTTEMHTCGEPVRIIEAGYPEILGETILEKMEYLKRKLDSYRKLLMHEPRGHFNMFGAILVQPDDKEAVAGVIFVHNEGYGAACGHAIISLGRYLVDRGFTKNITSPETEVKIQCPSGVVTAVVEYRDGKTGYVKFRNIPAYVSAHGRCFDVRDTKAWIGEFVKNWVQAFSQS